MAAAVEAGLSMARTDRFDFARARTSIDAGFPVIVFRRWSQERDYVHTMFAKRYAADCVGGIAAARCERPETVASRATAMRTHQL
jgi:hypothetical protein